MALDMKEKCEKCSVVLDAARSDAFICTFECTFCSGCKEEMNGVCPNCSGELVKRPKRKA